MIEYIRKPENVRIESQSNVIDKQQQQKSIKLDLNKISTQYRYKTKNVNRSQPKVCIPISIKKS